MLVNRVTGDRYIGQTVNIAMRMEQHRLGRGNGLLGKAFLEYGWKAFDLTILEKLPMSKLRDAEFKFIAKFNPEYNIVRKPVVGSTRTTIRISAAVLAKARDTALREGIPLMMFVDRALSNAARRSLKIKRELMDI
jgi:group I intron endonuclease